MKINRALNYLILGIILGLFNSCEPDDIANDNLTVNKWIWDSMNYYYFWYNHIPSNKTPDGQTNPEDYFNSLLYTTEDKWSFITDDYTGLMDELNGTPRSMGYYPAFGLFTGTDYVFIIVEYVYKNSPAEKAGLKRGDIIIKIDDQMITTTNYIEKYSGEAYTVTLGRYDGSSIAETNTKITLQAQVLDLDPVLCDSVYNEGSKRIGYIALSEFISYEPFMDKVKPVFDEFIAKNITDLVVDLRYNTGGEQNAAIWLASAIAPASTIAAPSVIIQLTFNNLLQSQMVDLDRTSYYFDTNPGVNLNMQNVYFLTTHNGTASASELVIVGLEPYMNVIQIGENTYGKYTGMWPIPDSEEPARHNWGILPIVMKYANAVGKTDFKDGLVPDSYVEDNPFAFLPFGSLTDPQISTAMGLITGKKSGKLNIENIPEMKRLYTPGQQAMRNLILSN